MPLILGTNSIKDTTYDVANSCMFNDGDSPHMHKTPGSASGTKTKFTFNCWLKRCTLGSEQNLIEAGTSSNERTYVSLGVFGTDELSFVHRTGGSNSIVVTGTNLLRDVSAWYMITVKYDSTDGTANNRVRLYINGTEVAYTTQTMPGSNDTTYINDDEIHYISRANHAAERFLDGYLAEVCLIDASALAPTSFGEFDEDSPTIWKPKSVTGLTFGTNGFYLDFEDSSNLGNDANGGTDLTEVNLAATDQSSDSPTNNFATFNSIYTPDASNLSTFSEGNLRVVSNSTSQKNHGIATIGPSSGKWYAEFKLIAEATGESACGVIYDIGTGPTLYGTPAWSVCSNGDTKYAGSNTGTNNWSGTYTTDDIISVALDLDNNKIYFAKNGSWVDGSGNWDESSLSAYRDLVANKDYFIAVGDKSNDKSSTWDANFGSPPYTVSPGNADGNGYGNFEYAVPSGFYALCTKNLAEYG